MRSIFGTTKGAACALCICVGLAIAAFGAGCGDDDDDDNNTPMTPDVTGEAAIEVSSGVAISTVITMQTFANGLPGVDTGSGKLARSANPVWRAWEIARKYAAAKNGSGGARVPAADCPGSGTVDFACTFNPTSGVSTATATWTDCTETSGDTTATLDGEIAFGVENPLFCATQEVQPGDDATLTFDNFSATVDVGNDEIESLFANFTMGFQHGGVGCLGGANGTITMNGTLVEESQTGGNYALVASNLSIDVNSTGSPCVATLSLDGGIAVTDVAGGRFLSESFDNLVMTVSEMANERVGFTLDGTLDVDCIGHVTFDTVEPIIFVIGAHCPVAGVLDVTLEDGTDARITYTPAGGVELDLDGDGTPDASFTSCDHEDLDDCPS
jgi:hypothetical protein